MRPRLSVAVGVDTLEGEVVALVQPEKAAGVRRFLQQDLRAVLQPLRVEVLRAPPRPVDLLEHVADDAEPRICSATDKVVHDLSRCKCSPLCIGEMIRVATCLQRRRVLRARAVLVQPRLDDDHVADLRT